MHTYVLLICSQLSKRYQSPMVLLLGLGMVVIPRCLMCHISTSMTFTNRHPYIRTASRLRLGLLQATRLSPQSHRQALDIQKSSIYLSVILRLLPLFPLSTIHYPLRATSLPVTFHTQNDHHPSDHDPLSQPPCCSRANLQCDSRQQHHNRPVQGAHRLEIFTGWTKHHGYHLELCICLTRLHLKNFTFEYFEF